ncbi:Flavodoxin domain-containing protein [Desulfacinum infernum DSM 9756]|jgi:flavodoxin|uniref:Flavodoxin domain-containing protein n=1 Tax=Desulfacinum infernum DSM 9756 TaxID=1121391 RepID=A0A1M4SAE2_9BACT|nr:flavodoxin domain-containing protein [Desulfacinum infernum]SHE29194.1 Flavodoxin domain-containing protein [Desulfacinum infernum DSM 9756]
MKVLIAYVSRTGNTEKMAQYMAEGVRFAGHEPVLKKVSDIKKPEDLQGYDAYLFGCPTYHRDMTQSMKTFLFLAQGAGLEGKPGGAFGSYTHSGDAPKYIYDTMEHVFKMRMTNLGSFNLEEHKINTPDGIRACQDYARTVAEMLNN